MSRYVLSPRAEQDIRDIWHDIAQDNEPAVDSLVHRLFDRFELAASQPYMGVTRPELGKTARLLIEGSYVVLYEPRPFGIFVVAVVYGGRAISPAL